jgi:hypothetical protein
VVDRPLSVSFLLSLSLALSISLSLLYSLGETELAGPCSGSADDLAYLKNPIWWTGMVTSESGLFAWYLDSSVRLVRFVRRG